MKRYLLVTFLVIFLNNFVINANAFSLLDSELDGYWVPNIERTLEIEGYILDGAIDLGASDLSNYFETLKGPLGKLMQGMLASGVLHIDGDYMMLFGGGSHKKVKLKKIGRSDFYIGDFIMKQSFYAGKIKFEYGIMNGEEIIFQQVKDKSAVIWKKVKFEE